MSSATVEFKLEVVVIPVADVDRAKRFYGDLGWRLDADVAVGDAFRVVQFTPPGSPCSIHFGRGLTTAAPGSAQGTYLVVSDTAKEGLVNGPDPKRRSYRSYATFKDPDGNSWLLQEITSRLPGRVD